MNQDANQETNEETDQQTRRPMSLRRKIGLGLAALFMGLIFIILLNSRFGVDREETFTDLHRPEIVGENQSLRP